MRALIARLEAQVLQRQLFEALTYRAGAQQRRNSSSRSQRWLQLGGAQKVGTCPISHDISHLQALFPFVLHSRHRDENCSCCALPFFTHLRPFPSQRTTWLSDPLKDRPSGVSEAVLGIYSEHRFNAPFATLCSCGLI